MSERERVPQPTPELPTPLGPGPSPFWPQHLVDLFFRPTRFFTEQLALDKKPYIFFVTWALGMSAAIDRIDTRIIRAELSSDPQQLEVIQLLIGTWPRLWAFVLGMGLLSGAFYWWIGGWWCKVRVQLSGDPTPNPRLARLLLIYSSFVFTGPTVLALLAQTALYPNYLEAFKEDTILSLGVLIAVFWSIATTYKGVMTLFAVRRARARLWFVILPVLFYFLIMGGFGALYSITP